jgi:hypothetical protein
MGKKKDKKAKKDKKQIAVVEEQAIEVAGELKPKLKRKEYDALLEAARMGETYRREGDRRL